MAHYDIFRHNLVIKYPAYGHALWEPSRGPSYPAVEVGDVGFIRQGRFHRLFNVLLPAEDPSHGNYGVPEYHEQLTLRMRDHIIPSMLSPNNLCSARVTSEPTSRVLASGPDSPAEVVFWCRRKQGAVLSLPTQARCEDTVALGDFGEWMIKHIDSWLAWVRQLGVGISRMEDIILVTGTHRTRSWTNVAFPGGQVDAQVSFGANVATRGDTVAINWKFSHECSRGALLNCGPNGEDLPEDQCIFIRGFRVTRKLMILPRELKAAAGPNPDPKSDDDDTPSERASATVESVSTSEEGGTFTVPVFPAAGFVSTSSEATRDAHLPRAPLHVSVPDDLQLISISTVPEYRDPLHTLLEYIAEELPDCDMALVHDDDLNQIDGLGDDTSLEDLQPDTLLRHLRRHKPIVYGVRLSSDSSTGCSSAETHNVALISTIFERDPLSTTSSSPDRVHGFDSAGPTSLRERSASQPPRTFGQNIISAHSHRAVSLSLSRGNPPWTQRPLLSFDPGTFSSSSSSKSSSFSTTAPSLYPSLGSTFGDDKSEAMSDTYDERYIPPSQLSRRSCVLDYTRSLSDPLATRPGPVGSPYSQPGLGRWNDPSSGYDPSIHRMEESKPFMGNSHPVDIPYQSTSERDVSGTLLDDGSGFREMWSGTSMHDIMELDDVPEVLNPLPFGRHDPGPVSSSSIFPLSQLSSLPIYAPHDSSPESFSPYRLLYPPIPGEGQALMKPSESELSTGRSPSLGPRNFQELAIKSQPEHSPTSPFIPGQDINHIAQPDAGFTQSSIVPRGASDTHSKLLPWQHRQLVNNLGKGVPLHDLPASSELYIVEFKAGRTDLFYATDPTLDIHVGDLVIVEADRGRDLGRVVNDTITLAEVEGFQRQQQSSHVRPFEAPTNPREQQSLRAGDSWPEKEINPKQIYGKAGTGDAQLLVTKSQDEARALQVCQNKVRQKKLHMKVVDAEYQWDRRKLTFYYIPENADKLIDFRELLRELFRLYRTRIHMTRLQGPDGMKSDQVSPLASSLT